MTSSSTVLFDLDGCLIDSRAGILASVHVAMSRCGLPPMPDAELEIPDHHGLTEVFGAGSGIDARAGARAR